MIKNSKKITTFLLSSAIIGAVSFSALAPVAATAQETKTTVKTEKNKKHHNRRGGRQGGFVQLVCSEDGAERLETMLSKVSGKITLTAEQEALYDTFKSSALAAQTDYADNCTAPVRGKKSADNADSDATKLSPVDRIKTRQANMTALVAAMDDVIPSMESFFDSLTDEQKAELRPTRDGKRDHNKKGKRSNS